MKFISVIIFLILISQFASGQKIQVFKGRVFDITTNEPMPFANISIPNTLTGVVSNEFGEFFYHIPESIQNGIIQVSFIGYESKSIAIDTINHFTIYEIGLQPKSLQINEVDIVAEKLLSVKKMVREAIKNINKNYPKNKFQLYGYYRDYIRNISTNDFNNLTEAAVIIEDAGFNMNDYRRTKIKLEQIRYNPDYVSDTMLNIRYDGSVKYIPNADISKSNELGILLFHNPIRNYNINTFSFVDVFNYSFIRNHKFNYGAISENDTAKIYEIRFNTDTLTAMEDNSQFFAEGSIHIKSDDLAIIKFTYRVNCKMHFYEGKFFEISLEYKNYLDKYYLSYISMNNYFEFTHQEFGMSQPKIEHFYQFRELFINKIVPNVTLFLTNEETIQKDRMLISNNIAIIPGFWDNYNFILNEKLNEE